MNAREKAAKAKLAAMRKPDGYGGTDAYVVSKKGGRHVDNHDAETHKHGPIARLLGNPPKKVKE